MKNENSLPKGLAKNLGKLVLDWVDEKDYPKFFLFHWQGLYKEIFEPNIRQIKLIKLIDFVNQANYAEAKNIVERDPSLIFSNFILKKNDGEVVSPLFLAFKNLDTYMWKIFKNAIEQISDEDLKNQYLENFYINAKTQKEKKEFFDCHSLLQSYEDYLEKLILWQQNPCYINSQPLDEMRLAMGKQLRKLPFNQLKEIFREGDSWKKFNFATNINLPPDTPMKLYGMPFDFEKLGEKYHIVRGRFRFIHQYSNHQNYVHDREAFKVLNQTRQNDLDSLISELEARFAVDKVVVGKYAP